MIRNAKLSFSAIALISLCIVFFNLYSFPHNILSWDVFGYYLYLPMTFIYHNGGLQDMDIVHRMLEQYHGSSSLYQAYSTSTGYGVIRYSMGMAVLYAPFFFVAHLITGFTAFPPDGFSFPYQAAILAGGMIYSIAGFYLLRIVLLRFFTDKIAAACLLLLYFGTNYFFHSSLHGSNAMSHNYLFTLYALLLWSTVKWHETFQIKYAVCLGLACGIAILARPSEAVCLLIPALWQLGSRYSPVSKLKLFGREYKQTALVLLLLFLVGLPQFVYWKITAGKFFYYSYGNNAGEGFEFLHPNILETLFSFRKGWLLYTPVMIFAIAGIVLSLKKKTDFSLAVFVYFVLNLFIVSSWTCWWYAGSFSQRSLIQSYAVLALPLGFALKYIFIRKWSGIFSAILLFALVLLNLFQTWQTAKGIIHSSLMTKEAYLAAWGKTEIPAGFDKLLLIDREAPDAATIDERFYSKTKEWTAPLSLEKILPGFEAEEGMRIDSGQSCFLEKPYNIITQKDHAKLIIRLRVFCTAEAKQEPGFMVVYAEHNGYPYGYRSIGIKNSVLTLNGWTDISITYLTPVMRIPGDKINICYRHQATIPVWLRELKVEVWEKK